MENIHKLFLRKGRQQCGLMVTTWSEMIKMEIVGYVPYPSLTLIELSERNIVGPDRVSFCYNSFAKKPSYFISPISKEIAIGEKLKVKISPDFSLLSGNRANVQETLRKYKSHCGCTAEKEAKEDTIKQFPDLFTIEEDGSLAYQTSDDEIVFYRDREGTLPIAVSRDYICLCSFVSPVTGLLVYALKSPEDLIPILKNESSI